MKKLFLTLCALALLSTGAMAQTDNIAFGAARFDDGLKLSVGVGTRLFGSVWAFEHLNVGTYGSLTTDLAILGRSGRFSGGLLAGPNVEWGNGESESLLTYLTLASGAIGAYDLSEKIGVNGFARYHFDVSGAVTYVDGWEAGGGLFLRF